MDGWAGPTWAQWNDTVRDVEATRDAAIEHSNNAKQWMAYAKRLEAELDEVWNLYRDAKGNGAGQRKLKEMALAEVEKLDPGSKMLDQTFRQGVMDKEYDEAVKKLRR